ncbi:RagB/SusD family nutrient uptake outer membrane protein [Arsenicibacter rosenii]|uniref:RagB/SusD family nutrient uptake outer membrane protein n=1 Tax=Arsenicibacter rosenii TaxID=1750698 RepID=A0A1S2VJS2_9BACT|nr:RagB/SusD family nutrient uptake outer membrane protein [Arsenicibacter rosenii]OIN59004.1 RagB/SusD family nutrient uptake outer membrane protein [Arsenicibacter rosenii]
MKLNHISKSLKIFGLATLLLASQSCKDVLKEEVVSGIGNDYINTTKGFNDALNAAYSTLRYYYGTQQGLTMTEYGTDIYATGADGGYKGFHFYDGQLNPTVDYLINTWDELYRGINTCNAIIGRAPNVAGVADATKKIRVAEAKFLRAHYYYLLLMQWGGVDLRLTETLVPTKDTKRASEAEMYAAIIKDLNEAITDLEAKAQSTDYGRATKPAAETLLAKVYLAKAYSTSKASDDFSKAAALCKSVTTNYGYKLLDDFASVFDENNQLNSEVVFAVQYTSDPLTNLTNNTGSVNGGNNLHLFFGMQYDVQPGMKRDVFYGRPFKRLRPTAYLLNTVFADRVNDSRYKKTFRDTWLSNNPGSYNSAAFDDSKTRVTFAAGDTAIFIPGVEWTKAQRAAKKYQVLVPSQYNEALFPTLTKFFDTKRPDLTYEAGSRDYFVFRLADVYLMLAEASVGAGATADAVTAINAVRYRAGWPGKKDNMLVTTATLDLIMEERARELAGEQSRWIDLKRWGKLVERVKLYNPQAAVNIKDFHVLRPIPQTQIDRSAKGSDGKSVFAQNTGY